MTPAVFIFRVNNEPERFSLSRFGPGGADGFGVAGDFDFRRARLGRFYPRRRRNYRVVAVRFFAQRVLNLVEIAAHGFEAELNIARRSLDLARHGDLVDDFGGTEIFGFARN